MKKNVLLPVLAALALGSAPLYAVEPQTPSQPAPILDSMPDGTTLRDDDDGLVEIVPLRDIARPEATAHGGPVVANASIRMIFLGSRWRDEGARSRQAKAAETVMALAKPSGLAPLARHGVVGLDLHATNHDFVDPVDGKTISDLDIQRRLDQLLSGRELKGAEVDAVYVILLGPGLESTLGVSRSGRDFAGYHNYFHASSGLVRYAVVPYHDDVARWSATLGRSLSQTLVNPEANGSY
jgi:hypothetical protein